MKKPTYFLDRMTRDETCKFIGCGRTKLYEWEKQGLLTGTYYDIGRIRLYITEKVQEWLLAGGETTARERISKTA